MCVLHTFFTLFLQINLMISHFLCLLHVIVMTALLATDSEKNCALDITRNKYSERKHSDWDRNQKLYRTDLLMHAFVVLLFPVSGHVWQWRSDTENLSTRQISVLKYTFHIGKVSLEKDR